MDISASVLGFWIALVLCHHSRVQTRVVKNELHELSTAVSGNFISANDQAPTTSQHGQTSNGDSQIPNIIISTLLRLYEDKFKKNNRDKGNDKDDGDEEMTKNSEYYCGDDQVDKKDDTQQANVVDNVNENASKDGGINMKVDSDEKERRKNKIEGKVNSDETEEKKRRVKDKYDMKRNKKNSEDTDGVENRRTETPDDNGFGGRPPRVDSRITNDGKDRKQTRTDNEDTESQGIAHRREDAGDGSREKGNSHKDGLGIVFVPNRRKTEIDEREKKEIESRDRRQKRSRNRRANNEDNTTTDSDTTTTDTDTTTTDTDTTTTDTDTTTTDTDTD